MFVLIPSDILSLLVARFVAIIELVQCLTELEAIVTIQLAAPSGETFRKMSLHKKGPPLSELGLLIC